MYECWADILNIDRCERGLLLSSQEPETQTSSNPMKAQPFNCCAFSLDDKLLNMNFYIDVLYALCF